MPQVKKVNNTLGRKLNSTEGRSTYDRQVKKLLADKQVLARIIKHCTEEFKDMSINDIIACIDRVDIEKEVVNPDGSVTTLNPEDSEDGSGNVYYDVYLHITTKGEHPIKIYIDVEAQNRYNGKYTIPERGIYYCSRMISRQGKEEFSIREHEYNKIKKVYSIWICPSAPDYCANTITTYKMAQELIHGKIADRYISTWKNNRFDLLEVVVICTDERKKTDNDLIGMLNVLLSNKLSASQKKEKLAGYDIVTESELGEEIDHMCDLSVGFEKEVTQRVTQRVTKQVRKEERAKSRKAVAEAKAEAKAEAENNAIKKAYILLCKMNPRASKKRLIAEIAETYGETVEQVSKIVS